MTDVDDPCRCDRDEYDCEIVIRPTALVSTANARVLGSSAPEAKLHTLGISYAEICALNKAIRAAGGHALAVPVAYRAACLSEAAAADIAATFLEKLAAGTGHRLGGVVHDGGSAQCWQFSADDLDAQRLGVEPGRVSVRVDRLDGHIWTEKEHVAFARMQGWEGL